MKQSEFGLPPEYQEIPEYFDAQNIGDDMEARNAVIESLLKEHKVQSVLDMTCGTGSQVFYLKERGYDVTGSDFSPVLLDIARKKAREQHVSVTFIDGDVRKVRLGKFDAVITIFNAVGHLTKDDFEVALHNIYHNLKQGGIYVFDIFNLAAMTDKTISALAMLIDKKVGNKKLHLSQFSTLNRTNGLLTSYNNYSTQEGVKKPKNFQSHFTLQIYEARELQEMLSRAGFEAISQYDMNGDNFIESESLNILTVAQKHTA